MNNPITAIATASALAFVAFNVPANAAQVSPADKAEAAAVTASGICLIKGGRLNSAQVEQLIRKKVSGDAVTWVMTSTGESDVKAIYPYVTDNCFGLEGEADELMKVVAPYIF